MNKHMTCTQEIRDPSLSTYGHLILCCRPCEYRYPEKLRKAGASLSTYKYCAAHRRLRYLYGPTDPRTMRSIEEKEKEVILEEPTRG